MDMQTIFNTVTAHLLDQNEQSMLVDGSMCAYRGTNGKKCAVGCLIPDELYDPVLEKQSARGILGVDSLYPPVESVSSHSPRRKEIEELHARVREVGQKIQDYLGFDDSFTDSSHLLTQLQMIHDDSDPFEWPDLLRDTADQFELEIPEELR